MMESEGYVGICRLCLMLFANVSFLGVSFILPFLQDLFACKHSAGNQAKMGERNGIVSGK